MSSTTYNHKEISAIIKSQPHVLSGSSREIKRFNKYNIIKDVNPEAYVTTDVATPTSLNK